MSPFNGALLVIFANALFSISHTSIRWLSHTYSLYFLMFIRFISGPVVLLPFMLYRRYNFSFNHWPLILSRTVCGFLSMGFYFYSFKFIEIGKATLIYNFSIVWTLILAIFLFNDKPSWQTKAAIPIALIGLYLVLRPHHLIVISYGEAIALIGSFFNAGVVISLKALRRYHDAFAVVVMNYALSSCLLFIPAFLPTIHSGIPIPTSLQLFALIISSLLGLLGQIFMTIAYEYTPATIAGSASLIGVPLMVIIGVIFFNEHPDTISIIGGSLVFCCLGVITRFQ